VALDVFAILFLSKIIEPIYGSKEYLKFTLVANLLAGLSGFTVLFLAYMFGPRLGFIL
jgi:membrane associated rhomboid family serine protease